jgi:hypothetical protein
MRLFNGDTVAANDPSNLTTLFRDCHNAAHALVRLNADG